MPYQTVKESYAIYLKHGFKVVALLPSFQAAHRYRRDLADFNDRLPDDYRIRAVSGRDADLNWSRFEDLTKPKKIPDFV